MKARNFGKYEVVGLLGRGGMAEAYLCRLGGLGGFAKHVVVKRIRPERLGEPAFLRMFMDEARLAANLNHPNIVQVFEIDTVDGVPYIAMEYVRGPTLSVIVREAINSGRMHVGHMAKIMAGACLGLHHAHSARSPSGKPLGLIHRDVSPQNIIVSAEGIPKLLDFGVAKAEGRLVTTQVGTLKGKLRYMSPEQLQNRPLDYRADVFSAGVCLCETTTGQNPFGARHATEAEMFRRIIDGAATRPSLLTLDYPELLERIVMWAIEPDPDRRCPSAQALHDALEEFVVAGPYASSARAVAEWMQEVVPAHRFAVPTVDESEPSVHIEHPPGFEPRPLEGETRPLDTRRQLETIALAQPTSRAPATERKRVRRPRRARWVVLVSLIVLGGGGVVGWPRLRPLLTPYLPFLDRGQAPAPAGPVAEHPAAPAAPSGNQTALAYLTEAERLARDKRIAPALDLLGKIGELKVSDPAINIRLVRLQDELETESALRKAQAHLAAGELKPAIEMAKEVLDRDPDQKEALEVITQARRARGQAPAPAPRKVALSRKTPPKKNGLLTVSSRVGLVYLDDEPIGRAPLRRRAIPIGAHTLQVRAKDYQPFETKIKVTKGRELQIVVPLVRLAPVARPSAAAASTKPQASAAGKPAAATGPAKAASPAIPAEKAPPPPAAPTNPAAPAPPPPAAPAPPVAKAPSAEGTVTSVRPKDSIPPPRLPRIHEARDATDLARVCQIVESEVAALAGVSSPFASGITSDLRRTLNGPWPVQIFPVGMYYFIISEAGRGRDKRTAAHNLAEVHRTEALRRLSDRLPAQERKL